MADSEIEPWPGVVSFTALLGDGVDPWRLLDLAGLPPDGRFLWSGDDVALAAAGVAYAAQASGPKALREVAAQLALGPDRPLAPGPRWVGGFAFNQSQASAGPWADFPGALFYLPTVLAGRAADAAWVTVSAASGVDAAAGAAHWARTLAAAHAPESARPLVDAPVGPAWDARAIYSLMDAGIQRLRDGSPAKLVLATRQAIGALADPLALVWRGRRRHPSRRHFMLDPGHGSAWLGASPERLVAAQGGRAWSMALAGTGTGRDWAADSPKEAREHAFVVDHIRAALAPFGRTTIGERRIMDLGPIRHLETPVNVELHAAASVLALAAALHPTPAVCGTPRAAALAAIESLEPADRGWYAGGVGWAAPGGAGDIAVGLRGILWQPDRCLTWAGAGLLAESDPAFETAEVVAKLEAIRAVYGPDQPL